ncbi:metalloregulator ArsR/SmtB family transcription factor [Gordonia sp. CPCC 205515]|uniref:ArsR/SmtB family transcription factor n=1 Tax=Gordonia sp. CPCC 205515 TaxID=3140791 RepID=UPI003AF359C9
MSVFEAIADPVRRAILSSLVDGPCRVVDLRAALNDRSTISRPAVSRHLRVLGEAGLVDAEDRGRERHYRLVTAPLDEVDRFLADLRTGQPLASPTPPIGDHLLDALDTEVHRAKRQRPSAVHTRKENSA